jgi:large subunit ribosomal protein L24
MIQKLHVKKGDTVKVITGKDKGKSGKVLRSFPSTGRILVEGVNIYKKHVRPRHAQEKGQTVMVPRSIHASNVTKVSESN